jgi:hypothetical protein
MRILEFPYLCTESDPLSHQLMYPGYLCEMIFQVQRVGDTHLVAAMSIEGLGEPSYY